MRTVGLQFKIWEHGEGSQSGRGLHFELLRKQQLACFLTCHSKSEPLPACLGRTHATDRKAIEQNQVFQSDLLDYLRCTRIIPGDYCQFALCFCVSAENR